MVWIHRLSGFNEEMFVDKNAIDTLEMKALIDDEQWSLGANHRVALQFQAYPGSEKWEAIRRKGDSEAAAVARSSGLPSCCMLHPFPHTPFCTLLSYRAYLLLPSPVSHSLPAYAAARISPPHQRSLLLGSSRRGAA